MSEKEKGSNNRKNSAISDKSIASLLKDKDWQVRFEAAKMMVQNYRKYSKKNIPLPIITALNDKNFHIRCEALKVLKWRKFKNSIRMLIEKLEDSAWQVRCEALKILGDIRVKHAVAPILNHLEEPKSNIKIEALKALARIKSKKAVPGVTRTLFNKNWRIRCEALKTLAEIKAKDSITAIINTLTNDRDWRVRCQAVKTLAEIREKDSAAIIISTLTNDRDWRIRSQALNSLLTIRTKKSIAAVFHALGDRYWRIRSQAIDALVHLNSDKAVESIINVLSDSNRRVRCKAISALGELGAESSIVPLSHFLDGDPVFRKLAVESICKIKSEKIIEPLSNVLFDEDTILRYQAVQALVRIKSEKIIEPLSRVLEDKDNYLRNLVVNAFVDLKSRKTIKPLGKVILERGVETDAIIRFFGEIDSEETIEPLFKVLKHENAFTRVRAICTLGQKESRKVLERLCQALSDSNRDVREEAAKAVGRKQAKEAVEPLIKLLSDETWFVRAAAARSLGEIKSEKAIEPLIHTLKDEDYRVSEDAATALKKIGTSDAIKSLIHLEKESFRAKVETNRIKGSILVVDDEADICELLGDFFEDEGYIVFLAHDAPEAYEIILEFRPDLVLTDIRMPGKSGLQLLDEIQEFNELKGSFILTIIISAVKDIESAISAMSRGAYDYVSKPFTLIEINKLVKRAFEKQKLVAEVQQHKSLISLLVENKKRLLRKIDSLKNNRIPVAADIFKSICGSVAHSLKGEFLHIGNAVEEIHYLFGKSPEIREETEIIERSLTYSQILLQRLLDFLDIGDYRTEKLQISFLMEKVESLARPRLKSNIKLEIEADQNIKSETILVNPEQLTGIILELINNAARAMVSTKGNINIRYSKSNENLLIAIKDNGPGIPINIREKLFEHQVSSNVGSGIGLYLSRKVLNIFDGDLKLRSTSENGTEFHILIPLK